MNIFSFLLSSIYYIKLKSRLSVCLSVRLLYKAEKPSVCLSVCPSDRHADISAVYASIETRLARNES